MGCAAGGESAVDRGGASAHRRLAAACERSSDTAPGVARLRAGALSTAGARPRGTRWHARIRGDADGQGGPLRCDHMEVAATCMPCAVLGSRIASLHHAFGTVRADGPRRRTRGAPTVPPVPPPVGAQGRDPGQRHQCQWTSRSRSLSSRPAGCYILPQPQRLRFFPASAPCTRGLSLESGEAASGPGRRHGSAAGPAAPAARRGVHGKGARGAARRALTHAPPQRGLHARQPPRQKRPRAPASAQRPTRPPPSPAPP